MGSDRPSNRRNAQWKRLGQTLFPLPPRCPLAALSVNVSLPPPKHSVALSPSHVLCFSSALGEMGAPTVMIGPLQQSFCTDTHTGNVCRDWTYSGNRTTTLCLQEPLWILQNTMRWGSAVFFFFFADIPHLFLFPLFVEIGRLPIPHLNDFISLIRLRGSGSSLEFIGYLVMLVLIRIPTGRINCTKHTNNQQEKLPGAQ